MPHSFEVHTKRLTFEIGEGAIRVPRWVYVALIKAEKNCLVDTGTAGNFDEIVAFCAEHGVDVKDLDLIINTHCHPDHIGGNQLFRKASPRAAFCAHPLARGEIEDIDQQFRRRPLPGFYRLIAGPVTVDRLLEEGAVVDVGVDMKVLHTPGHSRGCISLHLPQEDVLIIGDSIPGRTDVPIYEDVAELRLSIDRLETTGASRVISAFDGDCGSVSEAARLGREIIDRVDALVRNFLREAGTEKSRRDSPPAPDEEICRYVLDRLGFASVATLPIITNSIKAHRSLA